MLGEGERGDGRVRWFRRDLTKQDKRCLLVIFIIFEKFDLLLFTGEERRFEKLRRNRGWKFFFGLKKERKREEVRVTRNNGVGRGGNK